MNNEEITNIDELFSMNGWVKVKVNTEHNNLVYCRPSMPYHEFIISKYQEKEYVAEGGNFELTVPMRTNRFAYTNKIETYDEVYNYLAEHLDNYI
jgi:hypothetical protein